VLLTVFGCQMNKLDGELVAGALKGAGYDFTDRDEEADAVLMVTCSIRDQSEHRVRSHLGELARIKRERPELAVGVLGNGLGVVYPTANRELYDAVAQHGCLLTEFPPGERPSAGSFPRRKEPLRRTGRSRPTPSVEQTSECMFQSCCFSWLAR